MDSKIIVELAQFKARSGVQDSDIVAASQEAQDGLLSGYKGMISRELCKAQDEWWLVLYWESLEDAERAAKDFIAHSSTKHFRDSIDLSTLKITHLERVVRYS